MFRKRRYGPFAGELLVLVDAAPELPAGTVTLEAELNVGFVGLDVDGQRVLPVFTSEDALVRWEPQGGPFVGLVGSLVAELALANGFDAVAVDPASPGSSLVSREELATLAVERLPDP
jgi:hypothetical protein